jgi:hypothetical protein
MLSLLNGRVAWTKSEFVVWNPFYFLVSCIVVWREYFDKCFAKSSDFSLLLLARGPAIGVVSAVGGESSFGFLLFLIGFQIA